MRRLFTTAAGIAVLSASAAFAQNVVRPPRNDAPPPAPAAQPQAQPRIQQRETQKVPEQAAPAQDAQQQDDGRSVRASQLLGMELVLEDGNSQGKISDLIIDNQSGQVAYMIVETDQDYRPVPWKAVTAGAAGSAARAISGAAVRPAWASARRARRARLRIRPRRDPRADRATP